LYAILPLTTMKNIITQTITELWRDRWIIVGCFMLCFNPFAPIRLLSFVAVAVGTCVVSVISKSKKVVK
jgi:hypothetical protein